MKKNLLKSLVMGATLAGFVVGGSAVAFAAQPAPSGVKADDPAPKGDDKKDEKGVKKGKKGDKKDEKKEEKKE